MTKTHPTPHQLIDRLEQKYQRKAQLYQYEQLAKRAWEGLSRLHGTSFKHQTEDVFDLVDYELAGS